MRAVSLQASDFQRALGTRPVSRTAHFVLHVLPRSQQGQDGQGPAPHPDLSTGLGDDVCLPVDDPIRVATVSPSAWRLGMVLPKKQARRSVTRSLIRHQVREALRRHALAVRAASPDAALAVDGWVLRLRSPFDRQQYPSAASEALKLAVRQEMDELWARMLKPGWRLPDPQAPRSGGAR